MLEILRKGSSSQFRILLHIPRETAVTISTYWTFPFTLLFSQTRRFETYLCFCRQMKFSNITNKIKYILSNSQPHRITYNNIPPHSIQPPPILDYTATATNAQTTRYYTHITRFFHCLQINSSLHILPMLQANTRRVLYSLSPDDGHNDARNMLS